MVRRKERRVVRLRAIIGLDGWFVALFGVVLISLLVYAKNAGCFVDALFR